MSRFCRPIVVLVALAVATSVSAQQLEPLPPGSSVAILRPGGDADALGLEKTTITAVEHALHSMSYSTVGPNRIAEELKLQRLRPCDVLRTCDQAQVLKALGVDAVASIVVWLDEAGKRPDHIVVKVTRPGNWGVGEVAIDKQTFDGAVEAAIAMALRESQVRHSVAIRIEAMPPDAHIEIDHRWVGSAPTEVEVEPGRRVITVSAKGYDTESKYISVSADATEPRIYKIALTQSAKPVAVQDNGIPGADNNFVTESSKPSPSVWNYIIASGLFVTSAVSLTPAIISAANDGDCYEKDKYGHCDRYHFGVQSTILFISGLVALGGGITMIVLQPIEGEESLAVQANLNSLAVIGKF
jgi:hypothetical protein